MNTQSGHSTLLSRLNKNEPLLHFLFWLTYFLFPFLKSIGPGNYPFNLSSQLNDLLFGMSVFYISYLVFLPSKRNTIQTIGMLFSFVILAYLNFTIHNWLFGGTHQEAFLNYIISYVSTYGILFLFAYALYSVKDIYAKQRALEKAENDKKQVELSSLKSQINPHFLFNTLNTIYSSALKKDDRTADMVLKLSDSFRYLLQEGQKDFVPIQNEIGHLKDYISLQTERLSGKVKVEVTFDVDDEGKLIAPLLLMPFVENAFKYTSLLRGNGHNIDISLSQTDSELEFSCSNAYEENKLSKMDNGWQQSGIGILNTQKRLEALYPDRHKLSIKKQNNRFDVTLTLKL